MNFRQEGISVSIGHMQQIVSGAFPFLTILVCCAPEGNTDGEEQRGLNAL
jgi:hypothetical protein